nr:rod-binding protein [Wenxinia marina]
MREAAIRLEATFLSEMLGAAGLGDVPDAFGGGAGEAQFASMLRDAQAEALARSGGIGLAESIYRALAGGADG